jgi:hypothetical protein
LNNNYGDDNTNDIDNTNIPSPKKAIIDSSWCNIDIKNIISTPDVVLENNTANENIDHREDDDINETTNDTQDEILDDTSRDHPVVSDDVSDETKPENNEIEISEDKKNQ